MSWFAGYEAVCQPDAPLAPLTWYGLGGPARWLLRPTDADQLAALVRRAAADDIPWRVLGRGANVLVSDAGFAGAVFVLDARAFTEIHWQATEVIAGAGADFTRLVKQSVERGLVGLEGLAGIPGSVGGIVRMNAGGKYGSIADSVQSVDVLDRTGTRHTRGRAALEFGYRETNLTDVIVLAATLRLTPGLREHLLSTYRRIWQEKASAQPALAQRSAGCIFKNPPGFAAGALIDQCGLKGAQRGGASISDKHANFVTVGRDARAGDVLDLIALAKDRVRESVGVELELEIDIW